MEAQVSTLLAAIFAPFMGALADAFGVGVALIALSLITLGGYFFVTVQDRPAEAN